MNEIRLNKYISSSGYCSRRDADKLIFSGAVEVDGKECKNPATKIISGKNKVYINKQLISPEEKKIYLMLNKPMGYMSSLKDPNYDKFVIDLINDIDERIYPIGRLDIDSHGLLLLTNDGELTYKLTHPKNNISKKYIVKLNRCLKEDDFLKLNEGVIIDNKYKCKGFVEKNNKSRSSYYITIYEGRNRQIRKMFSALGYKVLDLQRIAIEELNLGNLKLGQYRSLTKSEIKYLEEI